MNSNKLTYSRTIEVGPEQAELLNHLVDRYILPVINKRVAQAAMLQNRKMTPEQELEAIIGFGRSEQISVPLAAQQPKSIAQAGLDTVELRNLHKILSFGTSTRADKQIAEELGEIE